MIVSDITGGLGNQMFQYACSYALAKKRNDQYKIDVSHLSVEYQKNSKIKTPRKYQLKYFNITADILPTLSIEENNLLKKAIGRLYRYFRMGSLFRTSFIRDRDPWAYHPEQLNYKKNAYFCGFWQSWHYFDEYKDDIKREFQIQENILSTEAQGLIRNCREAVGIHIRRGDYKVCDNWLINERFYVDALRCIKRSLGKSIDILVFCDEPGFAEELFQGEKNIRYITAEQRYTDLEEFAILSACKHHIISNSTFSWWAAYLGEQDDSITIAPVYNHWNDSYYLNNWIKIDMN